MLSITIKRLSLACGILVAGVLLACAVFIYGAYHTSRPPAPNFKPADVIGVWQYDGLAPLVYATIDLHEGCAFDQQVISTAGGNPIVLASGGGRWRLHGNKLLLDGLFMNVEGSWKRRDHVSWKVADGVVARGRPAIYGEASSDPDDRIEFRRISR